MPKMVIFHFFFPLVKLIKVKKILMPTRKFFMIFDEIYENFIKI